MSKKSIEDDFKEVFDEHWKEIQAKLDIAYEALEEACALSDKTGIPFISSVSMISQTYLPKAFKSKFKEIDLEVVSDLTDVYTDYARVGWQHSAVC